MHPDDRILDAKAVSAKTNLSRTTLWRLRRIGAFPQPIILSANRVGWPASVVSSWLSDRCLGSAKG